MMKTEMNTRVLKAFTLMGNTAARLTRHMRGGMLKAAEPPWQVHRWRLQISVVCPDGTVLPRTTVDVHCILEVGGLVPAHAPNATVFEECYAQ